MASGGGSAQDSLEQGAAGTKGGLLVVATPIGNLGDLTPRARAALADADVVLAEDTRRTRALLSHLDIRQKRVERLDAQVEAGALDRWLARLDEGELLVLVSDAGTPAVSDPGARLVAGAIEQGATVSALPGASAVTTAVALSGFGGNRFSFVGFAPRKGSGRRQWLDEVMARNEIVVLFESPARLSALLADLAAQQPERLALVARELTKLHEEVCRGSLSELAELERGWRGEITVVLAPFARPDDRLSAEELDERLAELRGSGLRKRDIARRLSAKSGWSARAIYERMHKRKR